MPKSTTRKILKITGIVIAAIILVAIGVLVYVNRNASEIADDLVIDAFSKSNLSKVYDMTYEDLYVNIVSGNIKLINFKISPKPGFYSASDSMRFANPILLDAMVPKLLIEGLEIGENFSLSNLSLESILIDNPQVKLIHHLSKAEMAKLKKEFAVTVKDTVKKVPSVDNVQLQSFNLKKGKFSFFDHAEKKIIFEAGIVDIMLKNALIRLGYPMETILSQSYDESSIQIRDVVYPLSNGFYDIRCGKVDLKIEENGFGLYDVEVVPKYSKEEFGKAFGKQTDRFDVIIDELKVVDLDIAKLVLESKLEITKVMLSGADVHIYRDKNITFDTTNFPKLPHQALGQIKEYIDIGKLEISKSKLLYEELIPGEEIAGKVHITNMYGTIYNITNSSEVINKNGPMKWDAGGNLFDAGLLTLKVDFPKDLNKRAFSFSGGLSEMEMNQFNMFTKSNLHVDINRGKINSMVFSADANADYSSGIMTMAYEDIKIKVLKEYTYEGEKKKGFLSSLANMVIKSSNPPKKSDSPPTPAEIFFVFDKNKAIINYMVKSLIGGIVGSFVPAAGMTKEKYEKQQEKETKKENRQNEKKSKKEERKQKREEKKKS